jgi:type I restriction enzyme, S subunit
VSTFPLIPLRTVTSEAQTGPFGSQLHSDEYIDDGIPVINPSNIINSKIVPDPAVTIAGETSARLARHRLEPGDLVFARRGELGRAAVAHNEATGWLCGTGSLRVRTRQSALDSSFSRYMLQSTSTRAYFEMHAVGSTMGNLNTSIVLNLPIPLPPLDDQRRIAEFLDIETARIDQLMNSQLKVLGLLEERANSRIREIIGQSVIVKAGGQPVTPLRRVVAKLDRPTLPTDEVITAFRDGQVTARRIRRPEGYTMTVGTEPQGQGVQGGDIVVHGLDGFAGAIGDSEAAGNCSPVYHVCLPINGGNSAFYGRLLRLLALGDYLALFGASARERAVDFRNWKIFGHAPIPAVEPAVQHEIGGLITKIRPLREEVNRFNILLAERRQALITAAVTGAISV